MRDRPAEEVVRAAPRAGSIIASTSKADTRDNGEDRLANLDELITAAREFDQMHAGASIQDFLAEITLASAIDRWDEDSGAVTLMTLHAAKGLEFPVVFIVALENGLLPHARAGGERQSSRGGAAALLRRHHPGSSRALSFPVRGADVSRPAASHDSLEVSRGAARRADRGPRPLGRGPVELLRLRSPPVPGQPDRHEPRPAAAPRDFRLMTAADLAGAASGVVLARRRGARRPRSLQAGRAGSFTPSMAWGRSWPSKAKAPAARGGSRSPSAPRDLRSGQVAAPAHGHARARRFPPRGTGGPGRA